MPAEPATTSATTQFHVVFIEDEPRIGHFDLADRLGHGDRRDVSRLIQRNRAELNTYGLVGQRAHPIRTGKGRIQQGVVGFADGLRNVSEAF